MQPKKTKTTSSGVVILERARVARLNAIGSQVTRLYQSAAIIKENINDNGHDKYMPVAPYVKFAPATKNVAKVAI